MEGKLVNVFTQLISPVSSLLAKGAKQLVFEGRESIPTTSVLLDVEDEVWLRLTALWLEDELLEGGISDGCDGDEPPDPPPQFTMIKQAINRNNVLRTEQLIHTSMLLNLGLRLV
jgi:hypothetical protein